MNQEPQRRYARMPIPLEVRLQIASGNYTARCSDIGLGGCYLESPALATVGERVSFEIQLPGGDWLPMSGEVVYVHPNIGCGVRFTHLVEQSLRRLTLLTNSDRSRKV